EAVARRKLWARLSLDEGGRGEAAVRGRGTPRALSQDGVPGQRRLELAGGEMPSTPRERSCADLRLCDDAGSKRRELGRDQRTGQRDDDLAAFGNRSAGLDRVLPDTVLERGIRQLVARVARVAEELRIDFRDPLELIARVIQCCTHRL